eukprot:Gb_06485 [translate_table: standard]
MITEVLQEQESVCEAQSLDMEAMQFLYNGGSATKRKRSKRSVRAISRLPISEFDQASCSLVSVNDEDEQLANCLVMLANGGCYANPISTSGSEAEGMKVPNSFKLPKIRRNKKPKQTDADYAVPSDDGEYDDASRKEIRYKCKTCNKSFHSYQALGGHRASHNKYKACFVRANMQIQNESLEEEILDEDFSSSFRSSPKAKESSCTEKIGMDDGIPSVVKKAKMHECSVCHRIFTTGQALGGHKRCHSSPPASFATSSTSLSASEQHNLSQPRFMKNGRLDLNMPPPVDEDEFIQTEDSALASSLGGDVVASHWPPIAKDDWRKSPCFIQPWWDDRTQNMGLFLYNTHRTDVAKEDEKDTKLGSKTALARGQDLGFQQGSVLVASVS